MFSPKYLRTSSHTPHPRVHFREFIISHALGNFTIPIPPPLSELSDPSSATTFQHSSLPHISQSEQDQQPRDTFPKFQTEITPNNLQIPGAATRRDGSTFLVRPRKSSIHHLAPENSVHKRHTRENAAQPPRALSTPLPHRKNPSVP